MMTQHRKFKMILTRFVKVIAFLIVAGKRTHLKRKIVLVPFKLSFPCGPQRKHVVCGPRAQQQSRQFSEKLIEESVWRKISASPSVFSLETDTACIRIGCEKHERPTKTFLTVDVAPAMDKSDHFQVYSCPTEAPFRNHALY